MVRRHASARSAAICVMPLGGHVRRTADATRLRTLATGRQVSVRAPHGIQVGYLARLDTAGSADIASKKVVTPAEPASDRTRPTVRFTTWPASSAVIDT
jgi:hypothetical protein